jgi:hypothetical protein
MATIGVRQNRALSAGHRISSEVHLQTTTGLLVGRTRTRSTMVWSSLRSGIQTLLLDPDGCVLMAGPVDTYEIGGSPPGHHERSDVWVWHVTHDVADRATQIAVIHTWNPRWLAGITLTASTVEAIAALLATSKMGDLASGGDMSWPIDEMPWARWPNGIAEPGSDAEDRIELPRPLRVQ